MAARIDITGVIRSVDAASPKEASGHGLSLLLTCCLAAGFASPLIGLVLSVVHSMIPGDTRFARIGMVFTFLSIPLLLVGSHMMDLIELRRR